MGLASLYAAYELLQRHLAQRSYCYCLARVLDNRARIFDSFCFRQFRSIGHMADDAARLESPVLRHQRIDEELAPAGAVGRVEIAKLTAQCACDRVAHDALMLRLALVGVVDKVKKALRFHCSLCHGK